MIANICGEVRDAWYAKESVRDIYQVGCPQLAAEFTTQLSGGSPRPVTAAGGEPSRAYYRSLGHPDHQLEQLRGNERAHRGFEQPHKADQTNGVRVPDPSLAGGLVFYQVRGHTRRGCFHYIRCLRPIVGLGDGGFVPGAGVDSDSGECPGL